MKILYALYQFFVAIPLYILATVVCSLGMALGSLIDANTWGHYAGVIWGRVVIGLMLIPVKVIGREHMDKNTSYVIVANHQGAFDIFLIYGYIGRSFKWMMKKSLRNVPIMGWACERGGHIMVDKSGPKAVKRTQEQGRRVLQGGTSLVVFPEGARSFTGHMGIFRKGAFQLADQLELPILPVTINGSFDVLPRDKGIAGYVSIVNWAPLSLTIHEPIPFEGNEPEQRSKRVDEAYKRIMSGLDVRYQGFVENPDQ